ncbi:MAG: DUF3109 family protein [Saprospiraceae bacterium]|jgi:hypothetical protein|nr:DUF3109 family protein [Saprospiraceae bacterium]
MLVIQDTLVSLDVVQTPFHCHLAVCKGACCTEGDYGAPVTAEEMRLYQEWKEVIQAELGLLSVQKIQQDGAFTYYEEAGQWGTTCHDDGACVFLFRGEDHISYCAIERAYQEGRIPVNKPISCHLYPIRVTRNDISGFEAWNYDEWDICSSACSLGKEKKTPLYRFVKEAIIRLKGQDFYDELEAAAIHIDEAID